MDSDRINRIIKDAKKLGYTVNKDILIKNLKEYEEWVKESREIRKKHADWDFIKKQPEPIKSALIVLIETGNLKYATKLAGMKLGDFDEIRRKARIPIVL